MKLLALLLGSVLLAGSQFAIVLTAAIEQPTDLVLVSKAFPGYNIAPATWVGEIDGHPFSVQGDVESAFAKLQAKHPNVDWDAYAIAVQTPGVNRTIVDDDQASGANRTLDDGSLLTKRDRVWGLFPSAGGNLFVPPRTCSVVCTMSRGRVMSCNDNPFTANIEYHYLADSTSMTCKECSKGWNGLDDHVCGGQLFHTDGWNVVLHST